MVHPLIHINPYISFPNQSIVATICDRSAGLRPQVSHLGISWDAYDRITNPGALRRALRLALRLPRARDAKRSGWRLVTVTVSLMVDDPEPFMFDHAS